MNIPIDQLLFVSMILTLIPQLYPIRGSEHV